MLPVASNAHWMPLASLVQVPFIWLLGPTAIASAIPFALIGAFAAPLAWAIGRDAGAPRSVSVGAGVLTAFPALTLVYVAQPDNFSLYQPLVAGSLWLAGRALLGRPHGGRDFALAGLLAGLATLSRTDGVLVLGVLLAAAAWDRLRHRRIPWRWAGAGIGLFVLTVAPWYLRQLAVFGSLSPSTASGRVLYLRNIGEWNSITAPATLDHLLGMGLGPLLATRVGGLVAAILIFSVLVGVLILVPFMVIGAWRRRRDAAFGPFFGYAFLLFAFSAIVSAIHVPGGTFIHSAVALAPHAYVLALEGVVARDGVGRVAASRLGRDPGGARLRGRGRDLRRRDGGRRHRRRPQELGPQARADAGGRDGARRRRAPISDRVMSIDASGYRYWTGHPGVVLVNDPLDTVEKVARAYGIRWLVLEPNDIVAAAEQILVGGQRPPWVGPPILGRDDIDGLPGLPRCRGRAVRPVTRREAWLTALAVFAVALVVRILAASLIGFPKPEDTAYYVGVARNLVEGRGLVSDALWSYGTPPLEFPRPAFEVWLPLPSLLAAVPDGAGHQPPADPPRDRDARRAGGLGPGRLARRGARLAARRGRRRGARAAVGPRPDAGGRAPA